MPSRCCRIPPPLGLPDAFRPPHRAQHPACPAGRIEPARVADPAAGSGAIEAITDELCDAAWALFQEIEEAGGAWAALESGLIQRNVAAVRAERQKAFARGKDILTGANAFPELCETAAGGSRRCAVSAGRKQSRRPSPPRPAADPPGRTVRGVARCLRRVLAKTGARPKIFLATLGTQAEFTAARDFRQEFLRGRRHRSGDR